MMVKKHDICKDIAEVGDTRFDTSNHELDRPLPNGKNEKVTGLMKDKLSNEIICYIQSKNIQLFNRQQWWRQKGIKKCIIKRKLKFKDYKNCLKATQLENKINQLEKNKISIDKESHSEFIKKI